MARRGAGPLDKTLSDAMHALSQLTFADWLRISSKLLATLYAIGLAVLLFLSSELNGIINLDIRQIVAGFVLLAAGFCLYFDRRLTSILSKTDSAPRQYTMKEAFDELFQEHPRVRILRVYGSTTQLMVQWFEACCRKDEYLFVNECRVMSTSFAEKDFPGQADHYNAVRIDSFKKWQSFTDAEIIKKIQFATSPILPQQFVVVLDEKALVLGTYTFRKDGPTALLDLPPIVFKATTEIERGIIRTYAQWFDSWFDIADPASALKVISSP